LTRPGDGRCSAWPARPEPIAPDLAGPGSTEELVGSVPDGTNADIDAAVRAAREAFDDPSGWIRHTELLEDRQGLLGRSSSPQRGAIMRPDALDAYFQLQSIYEAPPQAADAP
jgi:hypothetical protein